MPWLVVLGDGSWTYTAAAVLDTETGKWKYDRTRFESGVHEVDEAVAIAALQPGAPGYLLVTDSAPDLEDTSKTGMLTLEDIRSESRIGVQIRQEPEGLVIEEEILEEVPSEFSCGQCPETFPSKPARDLHVEFNHAEA